MSLLQQIDLQVLQDKVKILIEEETELKKLKINRMIENIDYDEEIKEIHQEIEKVNNALLKYSLKNITKKDLQTISIFDEDKVDKFINKVIITRYKVKFIFINGIEIEKEYSNGQSGNKKGWNLNKHRQPRQKGNQRSPRAKKVKMAKNKGRAFSSKSRDEVSLSTVIV